jgi:hypothetical protein
MFLLTVSLTDEEGMNSRVLLSLPKASPATSEGELTCHQQTNVVSKG